MNETTIRHWQAVALLSALMAVPLFGYLSHLPIQLWDEARLANTTVEMLHSHNWLIPSYGFHPDMWSTKPPMAIWLQALSVKVFGINEMAVRLPSAIAAAVLVFGIYFFCAWQLKRRLLGFIIAAVLLCTAGYVTIHVARTADYDALLITFITFAALSFFTFLHKGTWPLLYAAFLFLALGVLTKGIAALLIIPAFPLYALYEGKFFSLLRDPHTYFSLSLFLVVALGYYFFREHYNPGYIQAVWVNELGGRFEEAKEHNGGGGLYYLVYLFKHGYSFWLLPAGIGAIIVFAINDKLLKGFGIFACIMTACHHAVIAMSATKLYWYAAPEYPFLAVLAGLCIYVAYQYLFVQAPARLRHICSLCFFISVFLYPYYKVACSVVCRPQISNVNDNQPMAFYLMKALRGKPLPKNVTLVWGGYEANLEFYRKALKAKGIPFYYNDGRTLKGDEKVIVYKHEIKQAISDKFAVIKQDSFFNVAVYQLHGIK